jgi:hypothetical protein
MKDAPLILIILGVCLVWLGITGRLGAVLGAIFEPERMTVNA